jgi:hypothetical protein
MRLTSAFQSLSQLIASAEPVEVECRYIGSSGPRRLKFRAMRNDQQNADAFDPINAATQRFQTRRVYPMNVLEDHQNRILLR